MNKQLIVDYLPFEVKPEQISESIKENDGKLIVRGVLQRAGHTEASLDLAKLAGLKPASLLVEIVDEDGKMARGNLKIFR